MTSLYMYYAPCFVLVEHSVCHEPVSVLINIFTLLVWCLLSTLLVLTLTIRELRHWPSIAIVVIRGMGALECLHDFTIYVLYSLL